VARVVNRIEGMGFREVGGGPSRGVGRRGGFATIVVTNTTSEVLEPFSIVRVSRSTESEARGNATSGASNYFNLESYVWKASPPDAGLTGQYAVTQARIPVNQNGVALLVGATKVRLDDSEQGEYADPQNNNVEYMKTVALGKYPVLLVDAPGESHTWGYVLLGASMGGVSFAKITAKAGSSPPYRYSAVVVEHDGTSDFGVNNFEVVAGADLGWNLINVQEIGASGVGVAPLEEGSIVIYWPMGSYYAASASFYRGTY